MESHDPRGNTVLNRLSGTGQKDTGRSEWPASSPVIERSQISMSKSEDGLKIVTSVIIELQAMLKSEVRTRYAQ